MTNLFLYEKMSLFFTVSNKHVPNQQTKLFEMPLILTNTCLRVEQLYYLMIFPLLNTVLTFGPRHSLVSTWLNARIHCAVDCTHTSGCGMESHVARLKKKCFASLMCCFICCLVFCFLFKFSKTKIFLIDLVNCLRFLWLLYRCCCCCTQLLLFHLSLCWSLLTNFRPALSASPVTVPDDSKCWSCPKVIVTLWWM